MKKYLSLLGFLVAAAVHASPIDDFMADFTLLDTDAVMSAAAEITSERFPDADEVLVDDLVREAYQPDGTSLSIDDEYYKVLTEKGRREYMSREYFFDAAYGTCIVACAEIIKPDEERIAIDLDRNSAIATDTEQMDSNIYNPNEKTLALSIPGLEIGDVCHVICFRETTKARVPDTWADMNIFESTSPVAGFTYEIVAPAERPLRHVVLRDPVEGTMEASTEVLPNGATLHRWRFHDVPQVFPEPNMPPLHTQMQRVISSTAEDWPAISRWYWNLCKPRLDSVTDEMRETVASLVDGAESDIAKVRRIFTWVSQNVRYMGITTEENAPGYEPHNVSTTFHNRYGVCRDKAALLVAMLRLAGFKAYPVLIHAGAKMDPEVPLPFFNHAIAAVDFPDGKRQLMDPTNESTRDLLPAYLGNRSYLVATPEGESLAVSDVAPAEENLVRIETTGSLANDGTLSLSSRFDFEGVNDGLYRGYFSSIKPEQRRLFFEGHIKRRCPGAELVSFELYPDDLRDTEQPLYAVVEIRVPDWPVRGTGADTIQLPFFSGSLGYVNFIIGETGLRKRSFPLETEIACGVEETATIDVGDSLGDSIAMPDKLDIDEAGIRIARSVALEDGKLAMSCAFLVRSPEFSPEQYLRLKEILAESERVARQRPVFAAHSASAPDSRVLSDESIVTLQSADSWTIERTIERKILSYAGKKDHSEIKFSFNPAWENVEITSAIVSNANGVVHTLQPEELNIMDAPWVADAPRYPSGCTLVASLPGIDAGSVICVTSRISITNHPFFSVSANFRSADPIDHRRVTMRIPDGIREPRIHQPGKPVRFTRSTRDDGTTELVWELDGIAPILPEDSLPPLYMIAPNMRASNGDWKEYASIVADAFDRAESKGGKTARRKARELVRDCETPAEKVRVIRDFVARNIRVAGPLFTDIPLEFSAPDVTLADGYGHSADRALLLAAMLKEVGFAAEPVLAHASDDVPWLEIPESYPDPDFYSYVLVKVRARRSFLGFCPRDKVVEGLDAGDWFYLNDTDQYAELGTTPSYRNPVLDLDGTRGVVNVADRYQSWNDTDCSVIEIDANGTATFAVTNTFYGPSCSIVRCVYGEMPPEELDRHYQEMLGEISESALPLGPLELDLEGYPGRLSFSGIASNYAARVGSTLTLIVPGVSGKIANLRADKREMPLLCAGYSDDKTETVVILPSEVESIKCIPRPIDWKLPCDLGEFKDDSRESVRADGRREIKFTSELHRRPTILAPEEYPALLELNRRATHPRMKTLILELK